MDKKINKLVSPLVDGCSDKATMKYLPDTLLVFFLPVSSFWKEIVFKFMACTLLSFRIDPKQNPFC